MPTICIFHPKYMGYKLAVEDGQFDMVDGICPDCIKEAQLEAEKGKKTVSVAAD